MRSRMVPRSPLAASPAASGAFAVFSFCWALSALLDLAPRDTWLDSPAHLGLGISALAALLRPGSLLAFAAVNVGRLAAFAVDMPDTANHRVLFSLAAATILAAGPPAARRAGGWRRLSGEAWRQAFAPALRVELLLLYLFAVLHKLNWDYLDPEVSCAVEAALAVLPLELRPPLPVDSALGGVLVAGSLAIEIGIPTLLLGRRTRLLGCALAAVFHGALGFRFHAFSTGVFGVATLFLPAALVAPGSASARTRWVLRVAALALVLAFAVAARLIRQPGGAPFVSQWVFPVLSGLWVVGVLLGWAWLLIGARRVGVDPVAPGRVADAPWLLLLPALVAFNGLSPYLGLRTVPTFSMFSNLRTEGGITNHLFMPARALRVAGYQEDLVTLLEVRDPELRRFAHPRRHTFYALGAEIRRLARAGRTGIFVAFQRGERRVVVERAERDPELTREPAWWQEKWLRFRPVPLTPRRGCSW